ncbi:MAG: hypothetical protein PHC28_17310 [Flavobacterium sp.]|uniref:hypothetical protein n=1 Tax=Flavobacterium sp. TaxID=239 RepID=UPI00262EA55C|nr:hypothetical protein [Flavobacterium sp.]MDD5152208.1 hypothetical protein [Flavobacterium sp.]
MKKLIFACLIIANYTVGSAQVVGRYGAGDITEYLNPIQSNRLFNETEKRIKVIDGTQYLFPSWQGIYEIYFHDKKKYVIENLNYNIKSQSLEFKIKNDSVFQFDSNKIDFIKNYLGKYKFYNINDNNQLCQELYMSNTMILLRGYAVKLVDEVINPMTKELISNARYEKKNRYFCKINENEITEIVLKRKQILKLFGDKMKEVEAYVSKSKLSYTSEKDLLQIFQYYDSI